ncbi:MAG: ABC transporter substrate-binding protein, partial [Thermotoga sp.]
QVDLALINETLSLRSLPETQFTVFRKPVLSYYLLGLNTKRKPLDNPKVRLAISHAVDREKIVKLVAMGEGQVTGPLSPLLKKWAVPLKELPGYKRDVEKARELLKEAGYPNGISFKVMTSRKYNFDRIAQVLKDQLKDAGIDLQIEIVEWGIFIKRWKERDFDSFVSLNSGSIEPDIQLYRTFHTGGSTNVFGYSNPLVDKLLDEGKKETNFEKRREIYAKIQKILAEESPVIFLYSPNKIYVGQKYVKGFEVLSNEKIIFLKETYLEK